MKHSMVSVLLLASLAFGATSVAPITVSKSYAAAEEKKKPRRVKRAQTMRPAIYKKLDNVRQLSDDKKYDEALEYAKKIQKIRRNSYETAMTWNMVAYVEFNRENYAQAVNAYNQVLATKNLPESLEQTTLYSVAKLYLIQEDYKKSITALNKWFEVVKKPGPEAYILRAQMNYQLENYSQALPDVKKAIAIVQQQGKQPRESWLLVERAVYYQNKDFNGMERTLKDLISLYPKPQYWIQLGAVYNELGKPEKELSVIETAYEQGLLEKETHIVSFAQAMLSQEVPYKAAQVLIKGIKSGAVEQNGKNLSLLGDALMIAKEYDEAIKVMTQAAGETQAGKDFYKLAQIHTERQEWQQALENVNQALKDENFKKQNEALILKGLVQFNLNDLDAAKTTFSQAKAFPEIEKSASQWLGYIEGEQKRRNYMASGA
jgi:tetratricopeptide (TPR) repeat protein